VDPSLPFVAAIAAVVLVAGAVNGLAGFGFALVGTMALASVVDPATAVVFMILPVMAVNLSLARDLSADQLRTCGRRFGPLVGAALVGAVAGMAVLQRLPQAPLKAGLGVVTLAFVATTQRAVRIPGLAATRERCFVETGPAMAGVGAVSGLLFGGTNVGVQVVAYLRSCDLSHGLFVGVVAMVFLGLNGVRVAAAGALGLYPGLGLVGASAVAAVPAVAGVAVGKRLRFRTSESRRRAVVLALLTAVGVRLLLAGTGIA
jgi:uncharacterized membrane protein YfcA